MAGLYLADFGGLTKERRRVQCDRTRSLRLDVFRGNTNALERHDLARGDLHRLCARVTRGHNERREQRAG
jgi:hypothetical protein